MTTSGYWSNTSMAFYVILGLYTIWIIRMIKQSKVKRIYDGKSLPISYAIIFVSVLTIVAAFRLVTYGIGGADAITYKYFFEHCNNPIYQNNAWFLHQDVLFRYITKLLRLFTGDHHFYFFVMYGFMVVAYLLFMIEFCPKRSNYIPCLLLIFLYWRGFNTLRSNIAIAIMMIALILLYRKKTKMALGVAVSSFFVHKMAAIYLLFFPFYFLFTRIKLTKFRFVLVMLMVIFSGSLIQRFFLDYFADEELNGAYVSYATRSIHSSFWDNTWKIAFEQMSLGAMMWIYYRKIQRHILLLNKHDARRLQLVWMMCLFDVMTIPINYTMGVWRGYEFFYLPRIIMWCEILYLFNISRNKKERYSLNVLFLCAFIAWMVFRFYSMWESSCLMPYIFEPFVS